MVKAGVRVRFRVTTIWRNINLLILLLLGQG